jgi:RNA polymerase sigma-70 factor (ECF subfamily)
MKLLENVAAEVVSAYQPYWAVRAHLLQRLGRAAEASEAYDRAIGLAEDPAVKQFLLQKKRALALAM